MPWIGPALGIAGSLFGGGGGGGGGGTSSSGVPYYTPTGLSAADVGWQQAFGQEQALANQAQQSAQPYYQQALQQQGAINYNPYIQAGQQAGQQYGGLAALAGQQGNIYGQQAGLAGQQQQNLYGAANQIYQTAFDPQNELFQKTQQQLQDQVRAGQAARGLGTSAVGGAEENQAMQNLDLAWRQQQLANQATGLGAMSGASSAGGAQGQLVGANLTGQMGAYGMMPGYTQQAAATPISAQQYAYQQPAQAAQTYQQQMQNLQAMQSGVAGQAVPYMNYGQGAQQTQYANTAAQNAAQAQGLYNLGTGIGQSMNTPGSWLSNMFGSGSTGYGTGTGGSGYNIGSGSQADMLNAQWGY